MSYPDKWGQVENGMVVNAFPNPYNDPIIKRINENYQHEDHDHEVMWSDDRWEWFEKYAKAHLEDYLRWTWEHRKEEE